MLLALLAACVEGTPAPAGPGDTPGSSWDTPARDTGPPVGERDSEPADSDAGDSEPGDPGDSAPPPRLTGLSAAPHAAHGSLLVAAWVQPVDAPARVEYRLEGEGWRATPTRDRAAGPAEALIMGLPYGADVTWRVALDDPALVSDEQASRTGPAPEAMPSPALAAADPARLDPDAPWWLVSVTESVGDYDALSAGWWALVLDRQARVVWARRTPDGFASLHPRLAVGGDALLIDHNSFWGALDGGATSQVLRLSIDGEVVETYDTPGLHHPFTDTPDGALIWAARDGRNERLIERGADGEQRVFFDCQAWLATFTFRDICGSNSLSHDPASGRLLFSLFTLSAVIELDREGAVSRAFGALEGALGAAPPEHGFWWQHGAHYTPEGTLLLSTWSDRDGGESAVREYAVRGDALERVWAFDAGEGVWGQYMGEAHRLPGGNTLHNTGSLPRLREVTPEGEVVWDVAWEGARWIGRSTPLADLYALAP